MIAFRTLHQTVLGPRSNRTALRAAYALTHTMAVGTNGDLDNTAAARSRIDVTEDAAFRHVSLAIPPSQDDATVRRDYRPFLQDDGLAESDWISQLELSTALKMVDTHISQPGGERLRVLVLYGSMRTR
jgi:arsenic resistance protein ArsH